jgi:hypothetical protein
VSRRTAKNKNVMMETGMELSMGDKKLHLIVKEACYPE